MGVVAAAVVGLGIGIKKAYDGIDAITERAIEGFSMRTSIMRSYSTILGSAQQAQERFNKVSELGLRTEFTREQLQGVDTRLMVSKFRGEEADKMLPVRLQILRPWSQKMSEPRKSVTQGLRLLKSRD